MTIIVFVAFAAHVVAWIALPNGDKAKATEKMPVLNTAPAGA